MVSIGQPVMILGASLAVLVTVIVSFEIHAPIWEIIR
ncbi:hypothetical protein Brsp02_03090 [Brucella sp. NBRC 113783]